MKKMKVITFSGVQPPFCVNSPSGQDGHNPSPSAVWQQEVRFEQGTNYLVVADSGRGKSTLCSYITGCRNDYTGTIKFDDTDVRSLTRSQWLHIRRNTISCLYQDLQLFPELTAMENVEIKNRLTSHVDTKTITSWFEELGIADKQHVAVRLLSFGQQQRVALIRSLCQPFSFLLADEPVSHLDDTMLPMPQAS